MQDFFQNYVMGVDETRAEICKEKLGELITSRDGFVRIFMEGVKKAHSVFGVAAADFYSNLFIVAGTQNHGRDNPLLPTPRTGIPACPQDPYGVLDLQAYSKYLYYGCNRILNPNTNPQHVTDSTTFFELFDIKYSIDSQYYFVSGEYGKALKDFIFYRNKKSHSTTAANSISEYELARQYYNTARFLLIPLCTKNWEHQQLCLKLYHKLERLYYRHLGEVCYKAEAFLEYADIDYSELNKVKAFFADAGLRLAGDCVMLSENPEEFAKSFKKIWYKNASREAKIALLRSKMEQFEDEVAKALVSRKFDNGMKDVSFDQLQDMVNEGNSEAMLEMGVRLYDGLITQDEYSDYKVTELFEKAAEMGNSEAQARLAHKLIAKYNATQEEIDRGFSLLAKSKSKKCPHAYYVYGRIYQFGLGGVQKNEEEAYKKYDKGGDLGSIESRVQKAYCKTTGTGVEKNRQVGLGEMLNIAEETQSAYAYMFLGNIYFKSSQKQEAFDCYLKAAEKGYVSAEYSLATCYYYGDGVEKNHDEAFRLFETAAKKGHRSAEEMLGECYYFGHGTERNREKGLELLHKAAKRGDKHAEFMLGEAYLLGPAEIKDHAEAFKWYCRAADKGHTEAQYMVGSCFLSGTGTVKNMDIAIRYFTMSAEAGNSRGRSALINALFNDNEHDKLMDICCKNKWFDELTDKYNRYSPFVSTARVDSMIVRKWIEKSKAAGYTDPDDKLATLRKKFYLPM